MRDLQADLNRLSQDFNSELTNACRALLPASPVTAEDLAARYSSWLKAGRNTQLFSSIALAIVHNGELSLNRLDLRSGAVRESNWPPEWNSIHERIESRLSSGGRRQRGGPGRFNGDEAFLSRYPYLARALRGK